MYVWPDWQHFSVLLRSENNMEASKVTVVIFGESIANGSMPRTCSAQLSNTLTSTK